jgi:hypothetical protein
MKYRSLGFALGFELPSASKIIIRKHKREPRTSLTGKRSPAACRSPSRERKEDPKRPFRISSRDWQGGMSGRALIRIHLEARVDCPPATR